MTATAPGLCLLVAGLTLLSYPLGLLLGVPWLLPVLNTAPAYAVMVHLLRQDRRGAAVAVTLAWAAALAVFGTASFALWPSPPDALVVNGPAYREEIFRWIRTGEGREGDVRRFLPQHLGHLAGFAVLSLATASALSMVLGAVLMNYMSFYVASLGRAGVPATAVVFLGWQPWALSRVAAFCILGAVLAEPLLARLGVLRRRPWTGIRPYLWAAAACIALDWVLKALLAPVWAAWLRPMLP
jgi:hypothetical protein